MSASATATGKRVTVSVPGELVETLETAAAREDRSVSGQIVNILREWAARRRRSVVVSGEEFEALREEAAALAEGRADSLPTLDRLDERSRLA